MSITFLYRDYRIVLAIGLAALYLFLVSLWVPISMDFVGDYRLSNLLVELKPRALVNTIAEILHLSNWGFNAIKVFALLGWLSLILYSLGQNLLSQTEPLPARELLCYLMLGLLFAYSTVTIMTFGRVGILDAVPYCFVITAVLLCQHFGPRSLFSCMAVTCLLTLAVLAHEKSIFDLAIIGIWFTWKWGLRKSSIFFLPSVLISSLFLYLVQNKVAGGLAPVAYLNILQAGLDFFWQYAYSPIGIIFGGGALWIVFFTSAYFFITNQGSNQFPLRLGLVFMLTLLCLAPLLVAWDTNRMVGLIWLPTFLLLCELPNLKQLVCAPVTPWFLLLLCSLQLLIPPVLMPQVGVVPFNAYANLWVNWLERGQKQITSSAPNYAIRTGDSLLFDNEGQGKKFLQQGWHDQEPWGIWSRDVGTLVFPNPAPGIDLIRIWAKGLIGPNQRQQSVAVYANQVLVKTITLKSGEKTAFTITLPKPTEANVALVIEFHTQGSQSPISVGISAHDARILGIGLVKMDFNTSKIK